MILRFNVECVEYWISGRENGFMNILFFRNFSLLKSTIGLSRP